MALSRELNRRLQTEDEPLAKRLKLAENSFTSEDLPVTRKEDLILRWLCEETAKTNEDEKCVWSTLAKCLRFKNTCGNIILKSNVKKVLIETVIEKLKGLKDNEFPEVLDCCQTIFASRELCRYFQSDGNLLCKLMKNLFTLTHNQSQSNENYSLTRNCCIDGIEFFVTCYKQATNKEEFTEMFVSQILFPLCSLVDVNQEDKLGAETHKSLQQIIFGKSRYSQFKEYDGSDENFVGRIFAELKKKSEMSSEETTITAFSYFFQAAVGSYKNDSATIDLIFRNLLEAAFHAKIKVFASFHRQLTNVTFDYQNKIEETTLFEYLEKFVEEILSPEHLDSANYDALTSLASLNPLIIEAQMPKILSRILLEKREMEHEVNSYKNLMIAIITVGVRLRREQKLIPWILKAIEEKLQENDFTDREINAVFPDDFKKQFSKSVGNMTSMQTISVFRTLIFHLNNICESMTKDKNTKSFMLQAVIHLMSGYFEGVRIFDNSVPISGQEKFVQALRDLEKTLSSLMDQISKVRNNQNMISALLTLTWYWENMHDLMNYYVPDAVPEKLDSPISEVQINRMTKIDDNCCKKEMNKILIHRIRRDLDDEPVLDFSKLLGGLEDAWMTIIDDNPQIISSMNTSQILELAALLLEDIKLENVDSEQFSGRINSEFIQNDERFAKALVYQILTNVAEKINDSTSKIIAGHINGVKLLNRGKESKVLKEIKNDLEKKEWKDFDDKSMLMIEKDLKILLSLPLKYLSRELRTILLLFVLSVKEECAENEKIRNLCKDITMDLSEKSDLAVIDYLDPDFLLEGLISDKSIQRILESSLKYVTSWDILKTYLKKSQTNDEVAEIFLECLERVRPKLKNEEKEICKKAEQKLSKKMLSGIDEVTSYKDVKRLNVALRGFIANEKITDKLVTITKSSLHHIFVSEESRDEKLVAEGLKLVTILLKHRNMLDIDDEIINNIWSHLLQNPTKEAVQLLLDRTEPKALAKLFTSLHAKTVTALTEKNKDSLRKCLIVWECITSAPMGGPRQKLRTGALQSLLQALQITDISVESWPIVLKLVERTLAEALHVVEKEIDVVVLLAERSLREAELTACGDVLTLCLHLVKFNGSLITDRLPILLGLYRHIVRLVIRESRSENNALKQRELGCLALDIEKLSNALVKMKKDLTRISPYVIADLVDMFGEGVIPSRVKGPLEDSVGHFLSISDQHAISLLSRTLPTASRTIFQTLYDTYNKFYKFTGKI